MTELCLQKRYAPNNACWGCGPANEEGLRLESFARGDEVVADWTPERKYEAFANVLCGGICGSLLDCHMNWTAAWAIMRDRGLDHPPCTVTADYHVKLRRPTPTDGPVHLVARVVELAGERAVIEATLEAGGRVTASCRGTFVVAPEGHPAFGGW